MAGKIKDLTGQRFGKLIVTSFSHRDVYTWWNCKCDCGNIKKFRRSALTSGQTRSCGCMQIS